MEIQLSQAATSFVPVIMVLVSLSKSYLDPKWAPAVALVLSLAVSFAVIPEPALSATITQGVLMALTAAGLYSGGKTLGKAIRG